MIAEVQFTARWNVWNKINWFGSRAIALQFGSYRCRSLVRNRYVAQAARLGSLLVGFGEAF